MKKIITLLVVAVNVMMASANDYTDALAVEVNGVVSSQTATISLDQQSDGTYTLALKNFIMSMGGQQMGIGTIEVPNVTATDVNGVTTLLADQSVAIKEGDIASPSGTWVGPQMLGIVPVKLMAEKRGEKLYAVINIDMQSTLQQTIQVTFGEGGYQIGNCSFEAFRKEGAIDEPLHWHSFASSTGAFSAFVKGMAHTFVSNVVRPGTSGSHSVMLTSANLGFTVANGTMTTGRMNAGSMMAADPANHAEMDMSSSATDSNGDPFYAALNGLPDSLAVWVKFIQRTPNAQYPYATVSATITDGTYYQEPSNDVYDNIIGLAGNRTIASEGAKWQRISIPFQYVNTSSAPQAILVTISTNAVPGKGSTDTLYVDDLSLIYKHDIEVKGISVLGQELAVADNMEYATAAAVVISPSHIAVDTQAPKVVKTIVRTADGDVARIAVASQDLKAFKFYNIKIGATTTGIHTAETAHGASQTVYNLQGQRVETMVPGHVYIVKQGGKTVKMMK